MSHHSKENSSNDNAQKLLKKKMKQLAKIDDKILHLNDAVKAKTVFLKDKRCSEKSKLYKSVLLLLFTVLPISY